MKEVGQILVDAEVSLVRESNIIEVFHPVGAVV
jgi:hypothetical protein